MASPDMHGSSALGVAMSAAPGISVSTLGTSDGVLVSEGCRAPNTTVPMVIEPTAPVAGVGGGSATAAAVPGCRGAGGKAGEVAADKDDKGKDDAPRETGTGTGTWLDTPEAGTRTPGGGFAVVVTGRAGPMLFAVVACLAA